ncbi:hypothetical protein SAMN05444853_1064 [Pasteurella skyensis]|uniref:Uncharacterized protein n=1 Tax=Phocoenobacter skyensis TaxID=97481 RepID=A0A1H7VX38_9PAST|nr:hypothetical protein SAMN05444853_1064 [Pasteurella skyensis]
MPFMFCEKNIDFIVYDDNFVVDVKKITQY